MAIVKDEFEKTEGLVTQEDILEEIVGEIRDEFDKDELLTIQKRSNDNYDAFGMVKVTDFNRETGFDIEAERGDTLSGLVYNKLGRTPHLDDVVHVSKYKITVTQVSRSRIVRVQIQKLPKMEKE
jgi:CBS domain containing-hemolysin-like protein